MMHQTWSFIKWRSQQTGVCVCACVSQMSRLPFTRWMSYECFIRRYGYEYCTFLRSDVISFILFFFSSFFFFLFFFSPGGRPTVQELCLLEIDCSCGIFNRKWLFYYLLYCNTGVTDGK